MVRQRTPSPSRSFVGHPVHEPSSNSNPIYIRALIIGYAIFFLKRIGFGSQDFVFQYISRVFQWDKPDTATLQLANALGATAILVTLPLLTTHVIKRRLADYERVDLILLRISALVATAGPIMLWSSKESWTIHCCMFLNSFALFCSDALIYGYSNDSLGTRGRV